MNTLKPGEIFAENYKLVKLVDTGGFAEVWEAIFIKAGNTVALKIFPRLDADGTKNIENEYRNQTDLLHTNLVTARNFGIYEGHPYLEMLFFRGGNAAQKIGSCSEAEIAKCLQQIAAGLSYLHSKEIIHQDIKPNNFLLDEDDNYYLADLGLSVKIRQTIQRYTQAKNSNSSAIPKNTTGSTPPCYRAPELSERPSIAKPPIKATDIWSLGASIFEMATGDVPFGDMGGIIQMNHPEPPDLPEPFSAGLNDIIKKCLSKDTWERPKASELEEWAGDYRKRGTWPGGIITPVIDSPAPAIPQTAKQEITQTIVSKPDPSPALYPKAKPAGSKIKPLIIILIAAVLGAGAWFFLRSDHPKAIVIRPRQDTTTISQDSVKQDTTNKKNNINSQDLLKDSDGDGVPDSKDKCSDTPKGVQVNKSGCPDKDGDGVPDNKDECPDTKKGDKVNTRGCDPTQRDHEQNADPLKRPTEQVNQ